MPKPETESDVEMLDYAPNVLETLESFDEAKLRWIASDLARTWGWVMEFTVEVAVQSYLHVRDFKSLSHVTKDTTLFIIAGMVFHIKINHRTLVWTVVKIDTRPVTSWCDVHAIPSSPLKLLTFQSDDNDK